MSCGMRFHQTPNHLVKVFGSSCWWRLALLAMVTAILDLPSRSTAQRVLADISDHIFSDDLESGGNCVNGCVREVAIDSVAVADGEVFCDEIRVQNLLDFTAGDVRGGAINVVHSCTDAEGNIFYQGQGSCLYSICASAKWQGDRLTYSLTVEHQTSSSSVEHTVRLQAFLNEYEELALVPDIVSSSVTGNVICDLRNSCPASECGVGSTSVKVKMTDDYGDGWTGALPGRTNTWSIKSADTEDDDLATPLVEGYLPEEHWSGSSNTCLRDGNYTFESTYFTAWGSESSWEICEVVGAAGGSLKFQVEGGTCTVLDDSAISGPPETDLETEWGDQCSLPDGDPCIVFGVGVVEITGPSVGMYYDAACLEGGGGKTGCGGGGVVGCRVCFVNRAYWKKDFPDERYPDWSDCPCCVAESLGATCEPGTAAQEPAISLSLWEEGKEQYREGGLPILAGLGGLLFLGCLTALCCCRSIHREKQKVITLKHSRFVVHDFENGTTPPGDSPALQEHALSKESPQPPPKTADRQKAIEPSAAASVVEAVVGTAGDLLSDQSKPAKQLDATAPTLPRKLSYENRPKSDPKQVEAAAASPQLGKLSYGNRSRSNPKITDKAVMPLGKLSQDAKSKSNPRLLDKAPPPSSKNACKIKPRANPRPLEKAPMATVVDVADRNQRPVTRKSPPPDASPAAKSDLLPSAGIAPASTTRGSPVQAAKPKQKQKLRSSSKIKLLPKKVKASDDNSARTNGSISPRQKRSHRRVVPSDEDIDPEEFGAFEPSYVDNGGGVSSPEEAQRNLAASPPKEVNPKENLQLLGKSGDRGALGNNRQGRKPAAESEKATGIVHQRLEDCEPHRHGRRSQHPPAQHPEPPSAQGVPEQERSRSRERRQHRRPSVQRDTEAKAGQENEERREATQHVASTENQRARDPKRTGQREAEDGRENRERGRPAASPPAPTSNKRRVGGHQDEEHRDRSKEPRQQQGRAKGREQKRQGDDQDVGNDRALRKSKSPVKQESGRAEAKEQVQQRRPNRAEKPTGDQVAPPTRSLERGADRDMQHDPRRTAAGLNDTREVVPEENREARGQAGKGPGQRKNDPSRESKEEPLGGDADRPIERRVLTKKKSIATRFSSDPRAKQAREKIAEEREKKRREFEGAD